MKKLLLIPALIFTLLIGQAANATFTDVTESTSYSSSIEWMTDNGVIQGYDDGTFKPDQCVNRAEFLKMMYLTLDANIVVEDGFAGSNYYDEFFTDTSTDEWYWPYVEQALRDEAIEGYPDGTFKPGQCVNRAEAVKMAILGFDILYEDALNRGDNQYRDVLTGDNWFDIYIYSAVDRHAVGTDHVTSVAANSMPEVYFHPGDSMTRKEVAEMLYRIKTLTDNEVFGYVDTMIPNPLNYYVSPSNGASFLMPDGWEVTSDIFYTTGSGVVADYPSIIIERTADENEEAVAINQRQMDCGTHEYAATCLEINENYRIGVYDPSLEASYLMNKVLLTFREPVSTSSQTYSNEDFNLNFTIPEGWAITEENVHDLGTFDQLRMLIQKGGATISIATPPVETGYEGSIEVGSFDVEIEGLISGWSSVRKSENTDWYMTLNGYYIVEEDWLSNITFHLSGTEADHTDAEPDFEELLNSVEFSNRGEIAFDGCGAPSDYASEDWWVDFVNTWDAYMIDGPGFVPNHEALNDEGDYCMALDKSMFIFIPDYIVNGSKKIYRYDIVNGELQIAQADAFYMPEEFGTREGDYINVYIVDDYYGCTYIGGHYYYLENRYETVEGECSS